MSALRPRKSLGQNFLHDPAVIARIVRDVLFLVLARHCGQRAYDVRNAP